MEHLTNSNVIKNQVSNSETRELNLKDIAIIGISGKLPMADSLDMYWENIINKIECIHKFSGIRKEDIDKYEKFKGISEENLDYYDAAFLDKIDEFDPKHFHLSPKEAKLMDPRQRMFLQEAWTAIEDAGYSVDDLRGKRIGVYSGISNFGYDTYLDIIKDVDPESIKYSISGNFEAIIPSRISYLLDLKGPSIVVDTACSSSLVAIHLACKALRNEECESALVGSVRIHLFPLNKNYKIGFESTDGRTRAFDDSATGTGVGEGSICIMLKPLNKAKADGDHIYAVIKGTAINQDGNSIGITAPNPDSQADVIERAWQDAGVSPEDISYIESHGTGTLLGDVVEIDGINKAFSKYTHRKQFCGIGSVKCNIGHLYDASGLASVIKCIYALNEKKLPPSINYKVPNKSIEFEDSPVYVNTKEREWISNTKKRLCGISSFGLSGTNCHIVLEEAENDVIKYAYEDNNNQYLLVLSGKTENILRELVSEYLNKFKIIKRENPKDVCFTASVGRNHYNHRIAILFKDYEELEKYLKEIKNKTFEELKKADIFYNFNDDNNLDESSFIIDLSKNNLVDIAKEYVNGKKILWNSMYESEKRKRVKLPSKVFDLKRFWISIPESSSIEIEQIRIPATSQDNKIEDIALEGRGDGNYTDTEKKLGAIIKSVMEYEKLNVYQNFYEFGGDSILALNIYSKINKTFNINLSVADIFSYPTVMSLGQYIDEISSKDIRNNETVNKNVNTNNKDCMAIIGMAGRFPLANDIKEYWRNLCEKKDCISDIPDSRRNDLKNYLRQLGIDKNKARFLKAGYLDEIDKFDYEYFGYSLKEATLMDPVQRIYLEVVFEMLENAGYGGNRLVGSNTGVFVGYTDDYFYNYRNFISESDSSLTKEALPGNLNSMLSGRISYTLDLRGPSEVIDTACSSSLVALNAAIKSIRNGECDSAIVGGARLKLVPIHDEKAGAGVESNNFMIQAFDDKAEGLVEGEAVNAIMIKPLTKAIEDGDNIHAVIKGIAVNQDGRSMGIMAPRSETQSKVLVEAWNNAKINPETITYIETHGTGTKLGDLIEYEALKKAFELYTDKKQFCAIGSVKTNIGHTYQASGISSLIKAALSLEKKQIVPIIHFNRPNRLIDFEESPLYVNDMLREWKSRNTVRRCGINSFGLSGTNCHLVLEEFRGEKERLDIDEKYSIVTISAKNREVLKNLLVKYIKFIKNSNNINMKKLSYTTTVGRGHYNERIAFIVKDKNDFRDKLSEVLANGIEKSEIENVFYGQVNNKLTVPKNSKKLLSGSIDEVNNKIKHLNDMSKLNEIELREICLLYVMGIDIDWEKLYDKKNKHVIELPTYPFMKKRCWFEPSRRKTDYDGDDDDLVINDYQIIENKEKNNKLISTNQVNNNEIEDKYERIIIDIFKEVIGVNNVKIDDNFFELGGNSIKATQIVAKVYDILGILISVSDILSYPTVEKLSESIKSKLEHESNSIKEEVSKLLNQKYYDLSLKQIGLWVSYQVYKGGSALNTTSVYIIKDFDISVLNRALEAVVNRHKIMKTNFIIKNGEPKQFINERDILKEAYTYEDISGEEISNEKISNIIANESNKIFNLEKDPLIHVTIDKLDESRHLLIFVVSHIISDWWSMDVIMSDLIKYYKSFKLGIDINLKPFDISYFDYAIWHKNRVESDLGKLKEYWDNVLKAPQPLLNMRTDYERPEQNSLEGRNLCIDLDSVVINKLKNIAEINQGTMFMTLLTGVYILLYVYSGQTDIIVGTVTSGREHPQIENQVGCYINVLPLRLKMNGNESYNELFEKVKEITIGALKHQDYPFYLMQQNEACNHDSSRSPICDVMVQLLDEHKTIEVNIENEKIEEVNYDTLESEHDLGFNFIQKEDGISLELEYSTSLFKEETVVRMVKRLKNIFEMFSNDQEVSINKLDISGEKESRSKIIKRRRR